MKRPRSYDEDPSANLKEWDRHHRRFHEEDWDSSRSSRSSRRFDHGSFDRYTTSSSSPQSSGWGGGGGGERFHGSESFSALRRGFPKGFRSERSGRDRFRRERSESTWQLQRRSEEIGDRKVGNSRSVDSSSNGEVDKEVVKRVTREEEKVVNRESCSNSEMEMEEGELEPDHDAAVEAPIATVGVGADCEKEITNSRLETEEVENCKGREESESEKELEVNERKEEGEVKLNEVKEEVRGDGAGAAIIREEKRENGEGVMKDHVEGFETKGGDDVGDGEKKEARRGFDLEAEPEGVVSENDKQSNVILELMSDRPQESCKDKGKLSTAILDSHKEDYVDKWDNGEGPSSGRGFELVFPSVLRPSSGGIVVEKQKDDEATLETLDLSLGLSGGLPKPTSPSRATSFQSFPSSFRTMSDGFTNSISFSGSQTFVHNPSCSLTQNSLDNFEQSVGSRPLFGGVDQVSNGSTIWQAQTSNEPTKSKGGGGSLFQRILMNSNHPSHTSLQAQNFQQSPNPNNLSRQSSLPRQLSPAQSQGSRDTKSEHKDKRLLTSERSSNSIFRSEQHDGDQLVLNGGGFERIITKIISEPIQVVGRIFQDMTDQSIAYLKESISEMISNAEKHGKMNLLQEVLQRRTDLTMETMSKCHRNLLEILVALKTGLIDFLRRGPNIVPSSYMVDVFFNLKCRNIACRTVLPVDDCECKVCARNSGFCSSCMCLVCSKFDTASNTCGWVGCDLCLHWCHTDCGLRETYIRNGPTPKANGLTEMQFHCVACDHPSEMFGFVKDVFKQCAKSWKAETLAKELQYVRRIFSASNDVKGKRLCGIADRMMGKLQGNAKVAEIISYIMGFFSESESNTSNGPSIFPTTEPSRNNVEVSNGVAQPNKEATWLPPSSYFSEKIPVLEKACVLPNTHCEAIQVGRLTRDTEIPSVPEKNSVVDELESVVKFKQAEAKMYQDHADSARKEAEGLKRVAVAKNVQIEEEYNTQIARLRLIEAEERRKQKLEQLQAIERSHREFFNMKMKMESEIKDLLLKMEGKKHNFSS